MIGRPSRRYFLCDQSLKGFSGHCFAYFEPIAQVLQSRRKEVIIVGHKELENVVAARGVVSGFSYWCDERNVGQSPGLSADENADAIRAAHERVIEQDLQELDTRFDFKATDKIIINSIRHWAMRGVVNWLQALPGDRRPEVALLLHFTAQPERFEPDSSDRQYRDAFRAIELSQCGDRIHLYADATTLIDEYRDMTLLEIGLSPFPHSQFKKPAQNARKSDLIRVGYVGEARYHKGYHLLPFLVEHLNRTDIRNKIEFHFHSFIYDKQADFYLKSLPHLRAQPNVVLYPDAMTPEDYESFVQNCDVILIPYLLSYYHSQTSGIYADALGLGIPVVVSSGTWMAKELKRLGGGVQTRPEDYLSLTEATYRLCSDIEHYRAEARQARDTWCAYNTPGNLVEMFEAW
jgi:glycosyltransferase involved in cell wall biosynthesis